MIRRVFIANRGEIAVRIIRTARRLGLTTILGVSEIDRAGWPARLADEVVVVGPSPSPQSYLNIGAMVRAAEAARADAVHPGYGFLSENAAFARAVNAAGMIFVGPDAETLEAVGDKLRARGLAAEAGLPVAPGGNASDRKAARAAAKRAGYPLLVKAVAGGGGRGMKRVDRADDLDAALDLAMAEAQAGFGDARVYVERFVGRARHVEVQVLGDGARAVHLGARDCSIQRRYQKLVEETPAPDLPDALREGLHQGAAGFAERLNYRGAGTVEFLVDVEIGAFYFLEVNARIQVEHPVTEAATGVDLVEQQILIAEGAGLALTQEMIALNGCAIEARINAEDPDAGFRPCPGRVARAVWPTGPGLRVDTHVVDGTEAPPCYDSLLGKIIAHGPTRAAALDRLAAALEATQIEGVATTIGVHKRILADARFRAGAVDERFLQGLGHG